MRKFRNAMEMSNKKLKQCRITNHTRYNDEYISDKVKEFSHKEES